MKAAIISTNDAAMASNALREVVKRLRMRGADKHADRIQLVIDAMDADTIHIADGAGRA